jgi:hypothetical protein
LKVTSMISWISGILINWNCPTGRAKKCVDVKSAPHAKHTTSRISWLNTRGRIRKCASQFFLKLTKDEKWLDKTWNLSGGTRQLHIYGYKAS